MKRLKPISLIIILSFLPLTIVNAQGIPVFDASSFTQMLSQVESMAKDYQKQLEQLDEAIKQSHALTGPRYTGDLSNGILEKQLREYLPNSWQETLTIMETGNLPTGADQTKNIFTDLVQTYDPITGTTVYGSDPNGPLSKALDRRTNTTLATLAASEQAYNNISRRIEIYETLLQELNSTQDLKASVDLQARISAENGLILSELMRLHTIQMQQRASEQNELLAGRKRAHIANKFDAEQAGQAMRIPSEE